MWGGIHTSRAAGGLQLSSMFFFSFHSPLPPFFFFFLLDRCRSDELLRVGTGRLEEEVLVSH